MFNRFTSFTGFGKFAESFKKAINKTSTETKIAIVVVFVLGVLIILCKALAPATNPHLARVTENTRLEQEIGFLLIEQATIRKNKALAEKTLSGLISDYNESVRNVLEKENKIRENKDFLYSLSN